MDSGVARYVVERAETMVVTIAATDPMWVNRSLTLQPGHVGTEVEKLVVGTRCSLMKSIDALVCSR